MVRRSLNDLVKKHRKKGVMRADISEDKQTAQIYIQALDSAQLCFDIHALKVDEVENLQPAVSKVEAYYDSSMKTTRLSAIAGTSGLTAWVAGLCLPTPLRDIKFDYMCAYV